MNSRWELNTNPISRASGRTILPAGTRAPGFVLNATLDRSVSLHEYRGRSVVPAFYPADWSPVCGDQVTLYIEILPEFNRLDGELLGISVDGVWCHLAFARARKQGFPLLSNFEPKGAVARAHGAFSTASGSSERALYVISPVSGITGSHRSPVGVNPGADGILSALESICSRKE
ncbi:MAG TPA: redoxin domain-containing protein [Gemmatimonadales bacterium]|nr:redoxin domain-containing protein [Gemmatimonadales bacterium]